MMRPIPGWKGYFADENGDIWSTRAKIRNKNAKPLSPVAAFPTAPYGYLAVNVSNGPRRAQVPVHRLVALAFLGEPTGPHTRHLNGINTDNRPCNLAWGTARENYGDGVRHGTASRGERNGHSKLTVCDVMEIRSEYRAGKKSPQLAAIFGITAGQVMDVVNRVSWRHVEWP